MFTMLEHLMPQVPTDKPNHLLGIGDTQSLEHCVALGIDTSTALTLPAAHVTAYYLPSKALSKSCMRNTKTALSRSAVPVPATPALITPSYLRHLFKAHELSAYTLTSIHNIHFMIEQMKRFRQAILADQL